MVEAFAFKSLAVRSFDITSSSGLNVAHQRPLTYVKFILAWFLTASFCENEALLCSYSDIQHSSALAYAEATTSVEI